MYNPISTYRIQFNKDFTFRQFIEHIDYFSLLGTGTIYASPVFASAPGSNHGYDVVDPHMFNPEIGSAEDFDEISYRLKDMNIGWMQDIVPNHMAFHMDNSWLMDVLEHGPHSKYASYFDIDFDHPDFCEKLMVPVLGKTAAEAIEQGEIRLAFRSNKFIFEYYNFYFPVNEKILVSLLKTDLKTRLKLKAEVYQSLGGFSETFQGETSSETESITDTINNNKNLLKELLFHQYYKLCHWQEVEKHLNYRRFFTISSLICLQMDKDEVFNDYHPFIRKLVKEKKFQGLRIDHIDGLKDPTKYIYRLRTLTGPDTYMVVEKILGTTEELAVDWPIQGSSGYDFMAIITSLLTYKENYPKLLNFYRELTGREEDPGELIYQKKKLILYQSMKGDLDNLCSMFDKMGFVNYQEDTRITPDTMKCAIGEFLLAFPCYKLYSNSFPFSFQDQTILKLIIKQAGVRRPMVIKELALLQNMFIEQMGFDERKKVKALQFFLRCMQFTGPLMAKGVEDTAMYDYNCFIAHNEVGDAINATGISVKKFHKDMLHRQKKMSMTMNATATHDTKRGEDVRARLLILSELSDQWIKQVNKWIEVNRPHKVVINHMEVPNANEEYFIYQTLTGAFPISGKMDESFLPRVSEYFLKSLREAKKNTDWTRPNEAYEKAALGFVEKILNPENKFLKNFLPFQQRVAKLGINNSLIQVILKVMCPGIPDFYQGTELWSFSLVDPDNRRPVDFGYREELLTALIQKYQAQPSGFFEDLYKNCHSGEVKMWLTHFLMKERALHPGLFVKGRYIPLNTYGKYRKNILAFARTDKNIWYIVIVPLYLATLLHKTKRKSISDLDWADTSVLIPEATPEEWITFPEEKPIFAKSHIMISDVLKASPICYLKGLKES